MPIGWHSYPIDIVSRDQAQDAGWRALLAVPLQSFSESLTRIDAEPRSSILSPLPPIGLGDEVCVDPVERGDDRTASGVQNVGGGGEKRGPVDGARDLFPSGVERHDRIPFDPEERSKGPVTNERVIDGYEDHRPARIVKHHSLKAGERSSSARPSVRNCGRLTRRFNAAHDHHLAQRRNRIDHHLEHGRRAHGSHRLVEPHAGAVTTGEHGDDWLVHGATVAGTAKATPTVIADEARWQRRTTPNKEKDDVPTNPDGEDSNRDGGLAGRRSVVGGMQRFRRHGERDDYGGDGLRHRTDDRGQRSFEWPFRSAYLTLLH